MTADMKFTRDTPFAITAYSIHVYIDCLSTIVFILPLHLDYTKVIILILWWRNFQLEYWRTFQLVSTFLFQCFSPKVRNHTKISYDNDFLRNGAIRNRGSRLKPSRNNRSPLNTLKQAYASLRFRVILSTTSHICCAAILE